jgi:hypothetical protein
MAKAALTLFDDAGQPSRSARLTAAQYRRTTGMEDAERHADEEWKARAVEVLEAYLRTVPEFFVDDFWDDTQLERPHESRALGPLIQKAARAGWIAKTGEFRPSVASNLTVKPVWRSLLYSDQAAAS